MYQYTTLESYIKYMLMSKMIFVPEQLTMERLAKRFGLTLHFYDDKSAASAFGGQVHIFINQQLDPVYQWLEFCHEFCHATMHSGNQMGLPRPFVDYQESKAQNFIMHLSAPTFMILRLDLPHDISSAAAFVSETFNVPVAHAIKRLRYLERQMISMKNHEQFQQRVFAFAET